jgi:hypothetical protein
MAGVTAAIPNSKPNIKRNKNTIIFKIETFCTCFVSSSRAVFSSMERYNLQETENNETRLNHNASVW